MRRSKRDWEGGTTPNSKTRWTWFALRLVVHALFLPLTFDVSCLRSFTLTLFTAKLMDLCKSWPLPTIAASPVIGSLGFSWLIDPTFAGHRQR